MHIKGIKKLVLRFVNILLVIGIILPMVYFLYRFVITVLDKIETTPGFVPAVFSAWSTLSTLFLRMAFLSVIFIVLRVLTWLPSMFGRVKLYHRGTDVNEISLVDSFDEIFDVDRESFFDLYKRCMYDPAKVASLLPIALYAVASANPDAESIVGIMMNKNVDDPIVSNGFLNIKKQIDGKKHIALSYYTCATPGNGYQTHGIPITRIKSNDYLDDSNEEKTLYIACSGSGSYRPVKITVVHKKNVKNSENEYIRELIPENDIWIVDEFSATLVNVKNK